MSENELRELAASLIRLTATSTDMDDFCRRVVLDLPLEEFPAAAFLYHLSELGILVQTGCYGSDISGHESIPLTGSEPCTLASSLRSRKPRVVRSKDVCSNTCHRFIFDVTGAVAIAVIPAHLNSSLFGMLMLTFRQDVVEDERLEQESHLIQVSLESLLSGHWTKTLPPRDSVSTQEALAHMTPRQLEIINLLVDNLTSAQMARSLHVSESTVKQELSRIFKMLGVNDRAQARLVYLAVLSGGRVLRERGMVLG